MASAALKDEEVENVLELFTRIARRRLSCQRRIYTDQLVVWLMVLQNLLVGRSIRGILPAALSGEGEQFLGNCKRVREKNISFTSSGFSQARSNISSELFGALINELSDNLSEDAPLWKNRRVFIVDGMTLRLQARERLAERFPPRTNQISTSIFPLVRLIVAHDAFSGLAQEPEFGNAEESAPISEPRLAVKVFERLPEGSVILGDRAYGIFPVAYRAKSHGHHVVLRIQQRHIRSILGTQHPEPGVYPVTWKASKKVQRLHELLPDTSIEGRVVVAFIKGNDAPEPLYLFTTLDEAPDAIIELYGQRWCIETDIRHIKCALEKAQLSSTSPEMVKKELLAAVLAYNLVRATIQLAADHHKLQPSQFSFKVVLQQIELAVPRLLFAKSKAERKEVFDFLLRAAIAGKKYRDKRTNKPRVAYRIPIRYSPRPRPAYAQPVYA